MFRGHLSLSVSRTATRQGTRAWYISPNKKGTDLFSRREPTCLSQESLTS